MISCGGFSNHDYHDHGDVDSDDNVVTMIKLNFRLGQTTTQSAKCFALSHQDSLSQTLRRRVMSSIRWERLHISICFVFYILSFHLSCGRDYIFHIFYILTFSQSIVPLRLLMRRNTNPKWFRRTQFLMVRNWTSVINWQLWQPWWSGSQRTERAGGGVGGDSGQGGRLPSQKVETKNISRF